MPSTSQSLRPGRVFWLFGMSGAGKTTLSLALANALRSEGRQVLVLDGDLLRAGLCRDLGFSDEARQENIRRAAELARLALLQGQIVVAAFITPMESMRAQAREIVGSDQFDLVWVDTPLALCQQRDPKGLYRRYAEGHLRTMTGLDSTFESPAQWALRLQTAGTSIEHSLAQLQDFCRQRLGPPA